MYVPDDKTKGGSHVPHTENNIPTSGLHQPKYSPYVKDEKIDKGNLRQSDKLSYNGYRPSARWVDCWDCWTLPARQKISIVSERRGNDLYVCFKRNNFISSAPMLSK